MARWQPDSGHPQVDLAEAATFTPSKEEFADPFTYIASIAEQFVKQGIAKIVPPAGCWAPPQYVQQLKAACSGGSSSGGNGSVPDDLSLDAQRQFLSHLCMRAAPAPVSGAATTAAAAGPHRCDKVGAVLTLTLCLNTADLLNAFMLRLTCWWFRLAPVAWPACTRL